MSQIRVVWGAGTAPTALGAYDAALVEAGLGSYNLVELSSVIPADAPVVVAGTAPDLGPAGNVLSVVESAATAEPGATASAGIGWALSESGRGIFYEVAGSDEQSVREEIRQGLETGRSLREWTFLEEDVVVRSVEEANGTGAPDHEYACVVVSAAYGESRPVFGASSRL